MENNDLNNTTHKILNGISTIERFIEKFGDKICDEDYRMLVQRLTIIQMKASQIRRY